MRPARALLVTLIGAFLTAGWPARADSQRAEAGVTVGSEGAGARSASAFAFPLLTMRQVLGGLAALLPHRAVLRDGRPIDRDAGWQPLGFEVRERAADVYLRVDGRVQFGRAQVVFEGGDMAELDLRGAVRSNGVFELLSLQPPRGVMCVRMLARSASARSRVALRLGR